MPEPGPASKEELWYKVPPGPYQSVRITSPAAAPVTSNQRRAWEVVAGNVVAAGGATQFAGAADPDITKPSNCTPAVGTICWGCVTVNDGEELNAETVATTWPEEGIVAASTSTSVIRRMCAAAGPGTEKETPEKRIERSEEH